MAEDHTRTCHIIIMGEEQIIENLHQYETDPFYYDIGE